MVHQVAPDLVGAVGDAVRRRLVLELSRSRGVSIAWAARTKTLPVALPSLPSQRLKRMAVDAAVGADLDAAAVVSAMQRRAVFSARARCTVASYFAWIGQTGMQLALPQQAGRSSRSTEFRPCGVERTS